MKNNMNYMDPRNFKHEALKAYKHIFSGTIKESFLGSILRMVEEDYRFNNIFLRNFNPEKAFSAEATVLGKNYSSLNVCKMIVMNHYMNTFALSDSERGKIQENREYIKKLVNDVIKMCEIERLAASSFSVSSLESFLPIIYYTTALANYCGNKHSEFFEHNISVSKPYNNKFNSDMLYKILLRIRACSALVDTRASDEMMILFRSLAELFMTYIAIWDKSDSIIENYRKYDRMTFDFNQGGIIPAEIKAISRKKKTDAVKYLNYGWIEELEEYKMIPEKERSYSLGTLAEIVDIKYGKGFGTTLYKIYKACNPQTHGTVLFMNYFELELHIFQNIAVMLKSVCEIMSEKLFAFEFKTNGIDLIDELNIVLDFSRSSFVILQKDEKILGKTNTDYRSRFICSLRMKN